MKYIIFAAILGLSVFMFVAFMRENDFYTTHCTVIGHEESGQERTIYKCADGIHIF